MAAISSEWSVESFGCCDDRGVVQVEMLNLDKCRANPAREDRPGGPVKRPPLQGLPLRSIDRRRALRPDAMRPARGDREISGDNLSWPETKLDQPVRIIQVAYSQVVGQFVDPEGTPGTGHRGELEHRLRPLREIAKCFAARAIELAGHVPNVVVGVIGPATSLRMMLVERVTGLARTGCIEIGEDAIDQHLSCPTPHFSIKRFKHPGRTIGV